MAPTASQIMEQLSERLPLISVAIAVPLFVMVVRLLQAFLNDPLSEFPHVGKEVGNAEKRRQWYQTNAKDLYLDGSRMFKDKIFQLNTLEDTNTIVVPPQFLPELQRLPDDHLNSTKAFADNMHTKYTLSGFTLHMVNNAIKNRLNPALGRVNGALADEVDNFYNTNFPSAEDWTEVSLKDKVLRMIVTVSARVFVGPELCRDDGYVSAMADYARDFLIARGAVHSISPWIRWLIAPRLPEIKRLREVTDKAKDILRPIIAARKKAEEDDDGYEKPDDMLQWLIDDQSKFGEKVVEEVAHFQLGVNFAALHNTTTATTSAFYNLAVDPELVSELREEIRSVLKENDNVFSIHTLRDMKKLDSFLAETVRMHPMSLTSFRRKALKPIKLSNGQVIPANVSLQVSACSIYQDEDIYPDGDKFDGLRFYKLRKAIEASDDPDAQNIANSLQFVSVNQKYVTFGYGRHACPGRFFAANQIKIILAKAILRWDFRNAGGERERYPNIDFAERSNADLTKKLLFREVKDD